MIVVDTSTIIKGFIAHYREPKFIVDKIVDGTFRLAMTEEMAKELQMAVLATAITYGKSQNLFYDMLPHLYTTLKMYLH